MPILLVSFLKVALGHKLDFLPVSIILNVMNRCFKTVRAPSHFMIRKTIRNVFGFVSNSFVSFQFDFLFLELTDAGFFGFGVPDPAVGANSKELQKLIESQGANSFNIVDQVKVPEGLTGDFVFQWRWDSEQTAQVWTQCAVVTIEE